MNPQSVRLARSSEAMGLEGEAGTYQALPLAAHWQYRLGIGAFPVYPALFRGLLWSRRRVFRRMQGFLCVFCGGAGVVCALLLIRIAQAAFSGGKAFAEVVPELGVVWRRHQAAQVGGVKSGQRRARVVLFAGQPIELRDLSRTRGEHGPTEQQIAGVARSVLQGACESV